MAIMEGANETPKSDTRLLLIVPAYNEATNIENTVKAIREYGFSFIVVNDGSTDSTEEVLQRIKAPHIKLINNLGIGGAVQTGYKYAKENGFDIAIQFDGDGQHDASFVGKLIEPIVSGQANLVVGSRFVGDMSSFQSSSARRAGIKLLSWTLKAATGKRILDVTSGFRAADRSIINLFAENYPSDYPEPESIAYVISQGYRVAEVPVSMNERTGGVSSIAGFDIFWYMIKVGLSILLRGAYRGRMT